MARFAFVAVVMSLIAAGCTPAPDVNGAAEQALADGRASLGILGVTTPPRPLPGPREPARLRPLRTEGLAPAGEPRAPAPGAAAGPAAGMPFQAAAMSGSPPERILAWLGEPALRRAEGPVSIWLYAAAGCQLDVMFYPSAEGLRVAYVQARAGGFAQRTEAACLQDLAAQARRRTSPAPAVPTGELGGSFGMLG